MTETAEFTSGPYTLQFMVMTDDLVRVRMFATDPLETAGEFYDLGTLDAADQYELRGFLEGTTDD